MATDLKGIVRRKNLIAKLELARKGINPIDDIQEIKKFAFEMAKTGRGFSEGYDAGPAYLAIALKAATALSEFYAPRFGTISGQEYEEWQKEMEAGDVQPLDAQKIREAILNDPFAHKMKDVDDMAKAQEAETPLLPLGNNAK